MAPPPDAVYDRLHSFIAGIHASIIRRSKLDTYILFIDPFDSSAYIKFSPFAHKLEAKGISMAHLDKLCCVFNAVKGGIKVTELVLGDCSIRASLFYYIINDNTHSVILKNVHVAECNLPSTLGHRATPGTPGFWEDILPILVHQARLTYCHLEGLRDHSSQTIDNSEISLFHAESNLAMKKRLKALYWDLCWRTWCSDPVEHSLTELYHLSKALPDLDHRPTGPEERTVATRSLPTRNASQSSPTPVSRRR
jgi:hypothetical protein